MNEEQPAAHRSSSEWTLTGGLPTPLETLAAVSLMRTYLPTVRVRVINVVDLMKLQLPFEHANALSDRDVDSLFTTDKPIIFVHHGYP